MKDTQEVIFRVTGKKYFPKFDPEKLQKAIDIGTKQWQGVTNATEWVKAHRS